MVEGYEVDMRVHYKKGGEYSEQQSYHYQWPIVDSGLEHCCMPSEIYGRNQVTPIFRSCIELPVPPQ